MKKHNLFFDLSQILLNQILKIFTYINTQSNSSYLNFHPQFLVKFNACFRLIIRHFTSQSLSITYLVYKYCGIVVSMISKTFLYRGYIPPYLSPVVRRCSCQPVRVKQEGGNLYEKTTKTKKQMGNKNRIHLRGFRRPLWIRRRSRGDGSMKEIIIDIETLTLDPLDEKACVVAIGVQCGTYNEVLMSVSEKDLLNKFWNLPFFEGYFRVIGFNIFNFDLPYLLIRSFKWGVKMPDIRGKTIDLRFVLSYGNKYKNGKLEDYSTLFLGEKGKKTSNGGNVGELWKKQKFQKLKEYCKHDILLTYLIYERLKGMGVLSNGYR